VLAGGGAFGLAASAGISGEVGAVEVGEDCDCDFAGVVVIGEVDGVVVLARVLSAEVAIARGDVEGVVLATGAAGPNGDDFIGVVPGAPPKTVEPAPLAKVASPPVFHAGTEEPDLSNAA
jgi:hypothetical protein